MSKPKRRPNPAAKFMEEVSSELIADAVVGSALVDASIDEKLFVAGLIPEIVKLYRTSQRSTAANDKLLRLIELLKGKDWHGWKSDGQAQRL